MRSCGRWSTALIFFTLAGGAGCTPSESPPGGGGTVPTSTVPYEPPDGDADGLSDEAEAALGTDPTQSDTDQDGLLDGEEVFVYQTDPRAPDTDQDGLIDGDEVFDHLSDPRLRDTDQDALDDGSEVLVYGSDPVQADTDGDTLLDGAEVWDHRTDPTRADTDYDTVPDGAELEVWHTDPTRNDAVCLGFEMRRLIPFVDYLTDVRLADLDEDGDLDLLSTSSGKVAWYENDGAGGMGPQQMLTDRSGPSLEVVDLDADGDLDVVVGGSDLNLLENLGNGQFASLHTIDRGNSNVARAADVDDDGDLDLISAGPSSILWFENVDGSVASPVVVGGAVVSLVVADLDGDGAQDIVVGTETSVEWLQGSGDGTFAVSQSIYPGALDVQALLVDDIDGDDDLDVVVAAQDSNTVAWVPNQGSGSFGAPQVITDTLIRPRGVALGDPDRDGDLDVFSASWATGDVVWYENVGKGAFGPEQTIGGWLPRPSKLVIGDLDQDGRPDLAVGSFQIDWFANQGAGTFGTASAVAYQAPNSNRNTELADLDGDGHADLLLGEQWFENLGDGTFGAVHTLLHEDGERFDTSFTASTVDLDEDGDLDVIWTGGDLIWVENLGEGTFEPPRVMLDVRYSESFELVDIDGDGQRDLFLFTPGGAQWAKRQAPGVFDPWQGIAKGDRAILADVDSDGDPDVMVHPGKGSWTWLENTAGAFGPVRPLVGADSYAVWTIADLDGDGRDDLLLYGLSDDYAPQWQRNLGDGTFGPGRELPSTGSGALPYPVDLDLDGDLDLVISTNAYYAYWGYDSVAWLENHGHGDFGPLRQWALPAPGFPSTGQDPYGLSVGDVDGDGDVDVVTTWNRHGPDVVVFDNPVLSSDPDGDALSTGGEVCIVGTDPHSADSDGGGVDDGTEVWRQSDPFTPADD